MRICAVVSCINKGVHIFPADENLKRQWIKAIMIDVQRKIGWHLRKYSYVCSDHFAPSDYEMRGKLRRLKKIAVPSIFPWTVPSTRDIVVPGDLSSQDLTTIPSSRDIIAPGDLSSQDLVEYKFNPANAVKNYSRSELPTIFVEEYSTFNDEMLQDDTDPLQISRDNEYTEYSENPPAVPDESGVEIEMQDETTTQPETDSNLDQISQYCDKPAQTIDSNESFSEPNNSFFSIHRYKNSDKAIHFYTGLETFDKLMYVFRTVGDCSNLKYFYDTSPKLDGLEQFFIALMILRKHKEFEEIAMLYFISVKEVEDIFITWIRFMTLQWKNLDFLIKKEAVYDKNPMTRLVLDVFECPIKKPGLRLAQQVTFSSIKNRNTIKFLVGIGPSGLITYISSCYGGSATDGQILERRERSNILSRFNYSDDIKVDKSRNRVKVNTPTFFKIGQINPEKSKKVHMEKIIGMMKSYKILKQPMNDTEIILASDIAFVCAMLVNFGSNMNHLS